MTAGGTEEGNFAGFVDSLSFTKGPGAVGVPPLCSGPAGLSTAGSVGRMTGAVGLVFLQGGT